MPTYKEWRAVGIDVEVGVECREEGRWQSTKADAREDVAAMEGSHVPYDRIIVERRKVSTTVQVPR